MPEVFHNTLGNPVSRPCGALGICTQSDLTAWVEDGDAIASALSTAKVEATEASTIVMVDAWLIKWNTLRKTEPSIIGSGKNWVGSAGASGVDKVARHVGEGAELLTEYLSGQLPETGMGLAEGPGPGDGKVPWGWIALGVGGALALGFWLSRPRAPQVVTVAALPAEGGQ